MLLPALGGETANGFALIEGGATAIVEPAPEPAAALTGERLAAAVQAGAAVVVVAAADVPDTGHGGTRVSAAAGSPAGRCEDGAQAVEAIERAGGLRGARLVVLCEARDVATGGADSALAAALCERFGARLVAGAAFVLDALGFDASLRAAHAVVVGEPRLDGGALRGRVAGEIATRARQAGVPCHAVVGRNELDRFDARILDLQAIVEAGTLAQIEPAGEALAAYL